MAVRSELYVGEHVSWNIGAAGCGVRPIPERYEPEVGEFRNAVEAAVKSQV